MAAENYDVVSFARAMNDDFAPRVKKLFDPERKAAIEAQKTGERLMKQMCTVYSVALQLELYNWYVFFYSHQLEKNCAQCAWCDCDHS